MLQQEAGPMDAQAHHRQQELLVLVDAAVDRDEGRRHRLRRGGDLAQRARTSRSASRTVSGTGKVPVLVRWRRPRLGVARDPRLPRREIPAGRAVAGRRPRRARMPGRSRPRCMPASCRCAGICPMNMWRPVRAARPAAGGRRQRPAHRRDLDRLSHALRQGRCHSCSAHSAPPTRCMRRSCPASTPMTSRSVRRRARYMDAVMALPAWAEWRAAALKEPWVLPEDEVDWPTVLRE